VQSVFQDQQQLRPLIMKLQTQALYTARFSSILTCYKALFRIKYWSCLCWP